MSPTSLPLRLQGADFFLPNHAPVRAMPTVLDGTVPLHEHDFIEVALVLGGTGSHRTIYGDQPVRRGDAFVIRPGAWHGYHDADGLQLYETRFGLELLGRELAWDDPAVDLMFWAAPLSLDRRGVLHVRLTEDQLGRIGPIVEELHRAVSPEGTAGRSAEVALLMALVSELAHAVAGGMPGVRRGKPEPHQAVTDGIRLMEADLRRDWTLPEVARRLGLDKSYLVRLFQAHTGQPPMQFLARMRAEWAAVLLLRTGRDVAAIGRQVGWDDPNYFARRFKAEFGVSATKYRERFAGMFE